MLIENSFIVTSNRLAQHHLLCIDEKTDYHETDYFDFSDNNERKRLCSKGFSRLVKSKRRGKIIASNKIYRHQWQLGSSV